MNAETARMRLEDERAQMKMEEERRRRISELLMPLFGQVSGQVIGGAAPTSFQQYTNSAANLGTNDPRVLREEQGEPIISDGRIIGYQRRSPLSGNPSPRFQMGTIASRR
jgi:hypothetical protein